MTEKTNESIIVDRILEIAAPVNDELFLFAYNVFSDPDYRNIVESPFAINVLIEGVGFLKLATNEDNPELMSVWNDLIDLDVKAAVRTSIILRLMQIGQVFLYKEKLGKWLKPVEGSPIRGIEKSLVKACATVDLKLGDGFAITYDIDSLEVLSKIIDKMAD